MGKKEGELKVEIEEDIRLQITIPASNGKAGGHGSYATSQV